MPDIREILNALSIDDRALWSEQRTIMRRSYLNAHNETVGMANWSHEDDAFLDLIDIRLALLFDRAGRLNSVKEIIGNGDKIEEDLKASEDKMKDKYIQQLGRAKRVTGKEIAEDIKAMGTLDTPAMTEASKKLMEGFGSSWPSQEKE